MIISLDISNYQFLSKRCIRGWW